MMSLGELWLQFVLLFSSISAIRKYFITMKMKNLPLPEYVAGHRNNPAQRKYNREE